MTGERTHPILPCPDLDEAVDFYSALGFAPTYRQRKPNPYAVVELDDIIVHLAEIKGFDPSTSYASVIVTVPALDTLHVSFREGLRSRYTKIPTSGIPRLLRIRSKSGTATGFSVVDVGGNWLRFYAAGSSEDEPPRVGLGRVIDVAARQGDSLGDEARAIAVLDAGLLRHPDAPERQEAIEYRAELLERLGSDD